MRKSLQQTCLFLIGFICLAIPLRVGYMMITSFDERGNDVGGHIQYIDYLVENMHIPPRHDGWQFYQPPLYYSIAAVVMRTAASMEMTRDSALMLVQVFAFLLSLLTFGIGAWIAQILLGVDRLKQCIFLSFLASVPAFVYFTSRVNNDVLYQVFAFLACALMLQWWQKQTYATWIFLSITLGLGLLSKMNTVLLIVPAVALQFFVLPFSWKRAKDNIIVLGIVLTCISAWFILPPFFTENDSRAIVIGNVAGMTGPIPSTLDLLFTFNPIEILKHPFNEPEGDSARRQYHQEYFFRSMFFSEFKNDISAQPVAQGILLLAMVLLPFVIVSFIRDAVGWKRSKTFPLVLITIVLITGAIVLRIVMPFSSSSDFRYSIVLYIPFAYYALSEIFPKMRWVRISLMLPLVMLCIVFIIIFTVTDWPQ